MTGAEWTTAIALGVGIGSLPFIGGVLYGLAWYVRKGRGHRVADTRDHQAELEAVGRGVRR